MKINKEDNLLYAIMKYIFSWYIVSAYTTVIIFFSVLPISVQLDIPSCDKILHWYIYFSLTLLATGTCFFQHKNYPYRFALIYSFVVGTGIEVVQAFIPYRHFEFIDIGANSLGIFTALLFVKVVVNIWNNIMHGWGMLKNNRIKE